MSKSKIRGHEIVVPIERVHPNAWNYNSQDDQMFEKQKNSLEYFSLSAPVIVREIPARVRGESPFVSPHEGSAGPTSLEGSDGTMYEIIDGEHRWRAAIELGYDEIALWNLGEVPDSDAQQLTIVMNELKGQPKVDDLGILIKTLDEKVGRELLEQNLPYTPQQIDDLINTVDFDWSNFEASFEDDDEETGGEKSHMVRIEFRMVEHQAEVLERAIQSFCIEHRTDHTTEDGRAHAIAQIASLYLRNG